MNKPINPTLSASQTLAENDIWSSLLSHAIDNNLPVALWRLPESATTYLLLSNEYRMLERSENVEELPSGFLFSPFDPEKQAFFLPADFIFAFEGGKLKDADSPATTRSAAWLQDHLEREAVRKRPTLKPGKLSHGNTAYMELVHESISAVVRGDLEKVVPSHTKHLTLTADFNIVTAFQKLSVRYTHALVSFVSVPGVGNWLGASPESLLSIEDNTLFRTVALAGTLPYKEGMNLKSFAWTQKEIEEQALVERYVISCFKKIRLREYEEHGPRTVVAGNVVHLKSEFSVDMKATNFPQLGSVMLRLLHPTSAVCGMPLENALRFLKAHEGYDREFYAGHLGPVNVGNKIDLFVNIRCMKLTGDHAVLFAGAGVTADSEPHKELQETEMKFETLLNVIS